MHNTSSLHSRRYWLPDSSSKCCTSCDAPFTLLRRRHHCRVCGKIYCHACSSGTITTAAGDNVRVCDDCRVLAPSLGEQGVIGRRAAVAAATATTDGAPQDPGQRQSAPPSASLPADGGLQPPQQPALAASPPLDTIATPAISASSALSKEFEIVSSGGGLGVLDDRQRLEKPRSPLFNQPATSSARAVFLHLCKAADAHLQWIVQQAVRHSFPRALEAHVKDEWSRALLKLARRSVAGVDPNVRGGDRPDVRAYVKIKAIPLPQRALDENGGSRVGTCDIISGVTLRKSLPHKGMRHDVMSPRVMLLNDSISYEGRLNSKLLSLETLREQERGYLEILVNKILSLRPDVLFVSGTVSSAALEMLLRGSASVVPGVRLAQLHRISRMTGARILPSVNLLDKLDEAEVIGSTAARFYLRTLQAPTAWIKRPSRGAAAQYPLASLQSPATLVPPSTLDAAAASSVSYVVVEGAPPHLGCTVVIRGAPEDMHAAKRILRYAVYVARSLRLEVAFLFDGLLAQGSQSGLELADLNGQLPLWAVSALQHVPAFVVSGANRWLHTLPSSPRLNLLDIISYHAGEGDTAASADHPGAAAAVPATSSLSGDEVYDDPLSGEQEGLLVWVCLSHDSTQCKQPAPRYARFYSHSDTMLGQFLESACFAENDFCRSCKASMLAHKQSFYHHRGRLDITVKQLSETSAGEIMQQNYSATAKRSASSRQDVDGVRTPDAAGLSTPISTRPLRLPPPANLQSAGTPAAQRGQSLPSTALLATPHARESPTHPSDVITWAYCTRCKKQVAAPTKMSRGALSFSFFKYLELAFYNHSFVAGDATCEHAPALHHTRYFGRGRNVAFFRYSSISPLYIGTVPSLLLDPAWGTLVLDRQLLKTLHDSGAKVGFLTSTIRELRAIIAAAEVVTAGLKLAAGIVSENSAVGPHLPLLKPGGSSSDLTAGPQVPLLKPGGSSSDLTSAATPVAATDNTETAFLDITASSAIIGSDGSDVILPLREVYPPPALDLSTPFEDSGRAADALEASIVSFGASATPAVQRSGTAGALRGAKKVPVAVVEQRSLPRLLVAAEHSIGALRRFDSELSMLKSSLHEARAHLVEQVIQQTPAEPAISIVVGASRKSICTDALEAMYHAREWTLALRPIEDRMVALPGQIQRHVIAVLNAAAAAAAATDFSIFPAERAGSAAVGGAHALSPSIESEGTPAAAASVGDLVVASTEPMSATLNEALSPDALQSGDTPAAPGAVASNVDILKAFVSAVREEAVPIASQARNAAVAAMTQAGKSIRALLPGGAAAMGLLVAGPDTTGSSAFYLQPGCQRTAVLVDPRVVSTIIAHSLCSSNYWQELSKYAAAEAQGLLQAAPQDGDVADVSTAASPEVLASHHAATAANTLGGSGESGDLIDDLDEIEDEDEDEDSGAVRALVQPLAVPTNVNVSPAIKHSQKAHPTARSFARVSFAISSPIHIPTVSLGRSGLSSPLTSARTPSFRHSTWQELAVTRSPRLGAVVHGGSFGTPPADWTLGPPAIVSQKLGTLDGSNQNEGLSPPLPASPLIAPSGRPKFLFSHSDAKPQKHRRSRWFSETHSRRHSIGGDDASAVSRENRCITATDSHGRLASALLAAVPRMNEVVLLRPAIAEHRASAAADVLDAPHSSALNRDVTTSLGDSRVRCHSFHAGDLVSVTLTLPPPPGLLGGGRGTGRIGPQRAKAESRSQSTPATTSTSADLVEEAMREVQTSASAALAAWGGAGDAANPQPRGMISAAEAAAPSGVVGPITVTLSQQAGWGGASTSTAVVSIQPSSTFLHKHATSAPPLQPAASPHEDRSGTPGFVPAASREVLGASDERSAHNFGVRLPLTALDMLESRARVDIVHQFSDREAPAAPPPRGPLAASGSEGAESSMSFVVTSYWAAHFHALRELSLASNRAFVLSLAFAEGWNASGGKSGADFERTNDHRFLVKHVSKTEFDQFVDVIAAPYFEHMRASIVDKQLTLLVPILGAFRVVTQVRGGTGSGGSRRTVYAIVQADLFNGRNIAPGLKFDLKGKSRAQKKAGGSTVAAAAAPASAGGQAAVVAASVSGGTPTVKIKSADPGDAEVRRPGETVAAPTPLAGPPTSEAAPATPVASSVVLFDDDFLALNRGLPFPLTDDAKAALCAAVRRDTELLRDIGVVDYSLLVGVDTTSGEVVVGIIDYLRLFDTIKRLESLGKRILEADPTVIAPGPYMDRLSRALERYFVAVPNKWSSAAPDAVAQQQSDAPTGLSAAAPAEATAS